ncbi:MAG TPA: FixH family protein [Candidatus Acidoferrales bacterium]|nr:FixH family protein [Candidatus Acidoferrales bacterium]
MKKLLVALIGLLLVACSTASAQTATAMPRASAAAVPDAPLLTSEGGVLRPIENGSRLPMRSGYATVRLTPGPQSMDPDVDLTLFDNSGQPVTADVFAEYESLDMDHGVEKVQARQVDGCYRMRFSFSMQGMWRIVVHVARGATEEKLTLVLPWVGL